MLIIGCKLYYGYRYRNQPIFHNQDPTYKPKGFVNLLRWKLFTKPSTWPNMVPMAQEDLPPAQVPSTDKIRVSFIGHVTFLIQTNNINILTDPVWATRASPFKSIGPKRVIAPGVKLENLPKIDIIVISHNHYDHLDLATVKALWERDQPQIITPLANDIVIANYIKDPRLKVTTLNWHQNIALPQQVTIHLEPAQHWSARSLFDRNRALWGTFIIETKAGKICFIGDSGYNQNLFRQIGANHQILLSLIPIGAFEPRWFMQEVHMNPAEAVLSHLDLNSKY